MDLGEGRYGRGARVPVGRDGACGGGAGGDGAVGAAAGRAALGARRGERAVRRGAGPLHPAPALPGPAPLQRGHRSPPRPTPTPRTPLFFAASGAPFRKWAYRSLSTGGFNLNVLWYLEVGAKAPILGYARKPTSIQAGVMVWLVSEG